MIEIIKSSELTKDTDLVCTHCGFDHNKRNSEGKLMSQEGMDYVFERRMGEEYCICTECQSYCNEKGLT